MNSINLEGGGENNTSGQVIVKKVLFFSLSFSLHKRIKHSGRFERKKRERKKKEKKRELGVCRHISLVPGLMSTATLNLVPWESKSFYYTENLVECVSSREGRM